jgi:hypothetical protein
MSARFAIELFIAEITHKIGAPYSRSWDTIYIALVSVKSLMKSTRGTAGREAQGTLVAMEDGDGIEAEDAGTKENQTNRRHNKIKDETSDCYPGSSPTPESKTQEVIVRKRAGDSNAVSCFLFCAPLSQRLTRR